MTDYAQTALVSGLRFLSESQAAIANNLANAESSSFKRRDAIATEGSAFAQQLNEKLPTVGVREGIDWRPGSTRETGNQLDVSLDEGAFMRVQDGNGGTYYTRSGKLQLDREGNVVTLSGMRYLDSAGNPMKIDQSELTLTSLAISPSGEMSNQTTGRNFGQLGVFKLADTTGLRAVGAGIYLDSKKQPPTQSQAGVRQGYEENSNVDSLQEMVQMIVVQRSFAATQRALGSVDRMHDRLISNLNR
ncbi:flagellar basal-body rod protein FlgG [Planctomycetota bacterium]|jgi:flagellar basal-body rod protein FlgF|nr:flagellar basal-body rod protein FlgG [Planctomycetota bacterium]